MVVHSLAQVCCESDVENVFLKCRQNIAARGFGDKSAPAPEERFALYGLRNQFARSHTFSVPAVIDDLFRALVIS